MQALDGQHGTNRFGSTQVRILKVVLFRDTVSVEPGSRSFLDSVLVSKDTFMVSIGVEGRKDTFCLY